MDSFVPDLTESELSRKTFSRSLFQKRHLWKNLWRIRYRNDAEVNLFAVHNFPDEIIWIIWKAKQNLEIWMTLKTRSNFLPWESGPILILLPV